MPVANAGEDKSIPYGTYTFLSGSVAGGTNNYFYSWTPVDKLINANIQYPQTTNLVATTLYSLTTTDLVTNCISENQANISVEVTGGPLAVDPAATPAWICKGDTTQLHASAGGGNVGFYVYSWVSDPAGFTSTEANPFVHPVQNTTYTLSVSDGFNSTVGSAIVSIYPQPMIYLGPPDTTICIYDTLVIDAGNAGSDYLWSNGATSRSITVSTTEVQFLTVVALSLTLCVPSLR